MPDNALAPGTEAEVTAILDDLRQRIKLRRILARARARNRAPVSERNIYYVVSHYRGSGRRQEKSECRRGDGEPRAASRRRRR